MLFNSWAFLILFLPFTVGVFWFNQYLSRPLSNVAILFFCSLLFYGVWHPPYLILLLCSIGVNYLLARRGHASQHGAAGLLTARVYLILALIFNFALLGYFKYCNFFLGSFNSIADSSFTLLNIVLPLAISFYSLQQVAYQVDVYRRRYEPGTLLNYAFFVTFFPQLIAGPIVRYQQILPYIQKLQSYRLNAKNCVEGLALFQFGLAKKVLIADTLSRFVDPVYFAAELGTKINVVQLFFSSYFYCLQLYFDFAGYSTMAIGLAWMFGVKLPLNFIAPIRSASPREMWQRWHLTLTEFFRDYFYLPLNRKHLTMGGIRRSGKLWQMGTLLALFFLSGLWHGASWTFVIWGCLHGCMFITHHYWSHQTRAITHIKANAIYRVVASVLFLSFSMLTIIFFRSPDLDVAVHMLHPHFNAGWPDVFMAAKSYLDSTAIEVLKIPAIGSFWVLWVLLLGSYFLCYTLPTNEEMFQGIMQFPELVNRKKSLLSFSWFCNVPFLIAGTILFLMCLIFLAENKPFIYFQF